MTTLERIDELLRRAQESGSWHGPALAEALAGVDAAVAAARPIASAHTIWEMVLHVAAWESFVRRWLEGESFHVRLDGAEDWPPVGEATEARWDAALAALRDGHAALRRAVRAFPEARLDVAAVDGGPTPYTLMHGTIQHDLYHAGQMVLLKRAMAATRT